MLPAQPTTTQLTQYTNHPTTHSVTEPTFTEGSKFQALCQELEIKKAMREVSFSQGAHGYTGNYKM